MAETFSIGELGRRTGTKVNTIRFYEDIGLLPKPARTGGGRRIYGDGAAQRLAFIRHARMLGFSTEEIRSLLSLTEQPDRDCGEAAAIARRHLTSIEQRIAQLQAMAQALALVTTSCEGGPIADCRIIEAIAGARG
jgi:DNA-binding transcriptional MerR regulator